MTSPSRLVLFCFFVFPTLASRADVPQLIAHRAVYDVTLDRTTGSDIITVHGRMATQLKNTCDGWSTAQRLIADMTDSKGVNTRIDYFVTSWESNDGRTMRFDQSDMEEGKPVSRARGEATLAPDGSGTVEILNGKQPQFPLPRGTEFPNAETLNMLRDAQAGQSAYKHIVFQGGDRKNIELSTAVIEKISDESKLAADRAVDKVGLLRGQPVWTALISFFPLNARIEQPDYEIATHLFGNGISGSMTLIYPTYRLKATLVRLEALYPSC